MVKLLSFYQGRDSKKPTGGYRARPYKVKRKALGGGPPTNTTLSDNESRNVIRSLAVMLRLRLLMYSTLIYTFPRRIRQ